MISIIVKSSTNSECEKNAGPNPLLPYFNTKWRCFRSCFYGPVGVCGNLFQPINASLVTRTTFFRRPLTNFAFPILVCHADRHKPSDTLADRMFGEASQTVVLVS
jgi:hypothetical protein